MKAFRNPSFPRTRESTGCELDTRFRQERREEQPHRIV